VADVAKSILPKPEQMTGSDNFETEFMKGVVSGINSLASSLGDALVIEPQGGKVLVVPRTATAAIGKAYFDHERHRLLTKGNDAQWDDLSAQRQRELAEDALELFAALFTGKVYEAEAVGHFDCTPTDAHCGIYRRGRGVRPMFRKDLIAVGLKEVGK
jgi:hypothetical protein